MQPFLKITPRQLSLWLAAIPYLGILAVSPGADAQAITPAQPIHGINDTVVTPNGNQFDITGGQLSGDGANLFHSFQDFGLSEGQIANFLSMPQIQNILGRVTGGSPSWINGLIQVTGGNSNLFLINPAGVVFGPHASLNVPAAFTVTTANAIGFGNHTWLNAVGDNNWVSLVGTPSEFRFDSLNPASIVNSGNLAVGMGQSLTLLGGSVINTGTLTAPGGQITVATVPGQNLVRLSQPGHLLSLEVTPVGKTTGVADPLSLPTLLTGGDSQSQATGVSVVNGNVVLTASNTIVPALPGTTVISGTVDVSTPGMLGRVGGEINLLGNLVGVLDAHINASGSDGGGTIRIGGDYQGKGTIFNAERTVIDHHSTITADAVGTGNGGRVIIWGNDHTQFNGNISVRGGNSPPGNLCGNACSANGGFVEVSGKNTLGFNGGVDTAAPSGNVGTLLLDPATLTIIDAAATSGDQDGNLPNIAFADPDSAANTVSWGSLISLPANSNIVLEAIGDITVNDITGVVSGTDDLIILPLNNAGGSFTLRSQTGSIVFNDINDQIRTLGGNFSFEAAQNMTIGDLATNVTVGVAGSINLQAGSNIIAGQLNANSADVGINSGGGNIQLTSTNSSITTSFINATDSGRGGGGDVQFQVNNPTGFINTSNIDTHSTLGTGGTLQLSTLNGDMITGNLNTRSDNIAGNGSAGSVLLNTTGGNIQIGNVTATSGNGGNGGNVIATVNNGTGLINFGTINTASANGNAGMIQLSTVDGDIITADLSSQAYSVTGNRNGGSVILTTNQGDINTGNVNSSANLGNAAPLSFTTAGGNIQLGDLRTWGGVIISGSSYPGNAADVTIQVNGGTGSIQVGNIDTTALNFVGGDVTLMNDGTGSIQVGKIQTGFSFDFHFRVGQSAGTIQLSTLDGDITTTSLISAYGAINDGGSIILTTRNGNINTQAGLLNARGAMGSGGLISLTTEGGNIAIGDLDASTTSGAGGEILLAINGGAGVIETAGSSLQASSLLSSTGGTITFNGDVILESPNLTLSTTGTGTSGGNIIFNQTVNGTTPNLNNLTLNAGSGNLTFNGMIGNTVTPGKFTLNNSGTTQFNQGSQVQSLITNAGGTTEIHANITATANEGQIYGDPITVFGDVVLKGNELDFGSTVTGSGNLTLEPYSNTQTILLGGNTNNPTGSLNLTNTELNQLDGTFQGITINSKNQPLTVDPAGITFQSPVILQADTITVDGNIQGTGNAAITLDANATNLNGNVTTANQDITLNSPLNLGNDVTFSTGSLGGNLLVNGTINGNAALTLETGMGNITLNRDIGNTTPLTDITINSGNNLTTQNIAASRLTQLAGTGTTTVNGLLNLTGELTLTGNNFDFNRNVAAANITLMGNTMRLGGNITTGNLDLQGTTVNLAANTSGTHLNITGDTVNLSGNTTATGDINVVAANLTLNGNTTGTNLNLTGDTFNLNGIITTTNQGNLTLNNTNAVTLLANNLILDGNFSQIGSGIVNLSGTLTTPHGNLKFASPVTLTGDSVFSTANGEIELGNTLTAGNFPLQLTATEINFKNTVSGTHRLTLQPSSPNAAIQLNGVADTDANTLNLTATELGFFSNGFSQITIGRTDFTGTLTAEPGLSFADPVTLQAGSGTLTANDITGTDNASLTLNAATLNLNGNLQTANQAMNLNGNVILHNNINLETGGGAGDIRIAGTIDGSQQLTLNGGTGTVQLLGNLGKTTPLNRFQVNAATTQIGGSLTTGAGDIIFNSGVILTQPDTIFTTTSGNITFGNGINGTIAGQNHLSLKADQGKITLNQVGDQQPLGNLVIVNAANVIGNSPLAANGIDILSSGTVTFSNDITATGDVTITSQTDVTVGNIFSTGAGIRLTSNTGNLVTRNLDASNVAGAGGTISLLSSQGTITTGNLNTSGIQGGNILVDAELAITAGQINSSGSVGSGGNVTLDPLGDIQVEWINAQGGSNGIGGTVFIESTGGFFRATSSFPTTSGDTASISTAGGLGGGDITIRHVGGDGGPPIQPFVIGDPSINGTQAAITTGTNTLNLGESFPASFTRGNIVIATDDAVPTPTPSPLPLPSPAPLPVPSAAPILTPTPTPLPIPSATPIITPTPLPVPSPPPILTPTPIPSPISQPTILELISTPISTDPTPQIFLDPQTLPTPPILPAIQILPAPKIPPAFLPPEFPAVVSTVVASPQNPVLINPIPTMIPNPSESPTLMQPPENEPIQELVVKEMPKLEIDAAVEAIEASLTQEFVAYLSQTEDTGEIGSNSRFASQINSAENRDLDASRENAANCSADASRGGAANCSTDASRADAANSDADSSREGATNSSTDASRGDAANPDIDSSRGDAANSDIDSSRGDASNSSETVFKNSRDVSETLNTPEFAATANTKILSLTDIQQRLQMAEKQTGVKTAVVYFIFGQKIMGLNSLLVCPSQSRTHLISEVEKQLQQPTACGRTPTDPLEILVVTGAGEPIHLRLQINRQQILALVKQLLSEITNPRKLQTTSYLAPAQKLYHYLMTPIQPDLKARGIQHLILIPDAGLRSLSFAALHDGQKFLIENYSLSLMPSFSLTQPEYVNLKNSHVLAMGASQFPDHTPLPAVPVELDTITCADNLAIYPCWQGKSFLNSDFTLNNLEAQRQVDHFGIIHLATHANFLPGIPSQSYIQLWDSRLHLNQMRQLRWNDPPVQMLVLSACRTALGDQEVELGFAGLGVQAGVKSALATLWYISDQGTLALMSDFYYHLKFAAIRGEALRQAQLAMLRRQLLILSGKLAMADRGTQVRLPRELAGARDTDFSHPYYWAPFTLIGNPW